MEQEAAKASRESKRLRLDMRRRGHVCATKKGEDPAADAREKALSRLATRGVVLLFNAVAKAQKERQDAATASASGGGAKAVKLNKASFLAQLRGSAAHGGDDAAEGKGQAPQRSVLGLAAAKKAPGWKVLQEGFTGLPGGATEMEQFICTSSARSCTRAPSALPRNVDAGSSKMKDWDKDADSDEGAGPENIEIEESDEEDQGW